MYDITISVVLFKNSIAEITSLFNSINQIKLKYKVYVVDNSPTKALAEIVTQYKNVVYIYSDENIGYGKAHNKAIREINNLSRYHIIVNPDVTFDGGTVESLFSYMEQHPDIGHLMPRVLYEDGTIQKLCKMLPKPSDLIVRRILAAFDKKAELQYDLPEFDYKSQLDVPILSGCFMFIRTNIFQKVKGFDPRFFLYLEDFDLTRRIHEISRTVYYPYVSIVHRFKKESYTNPKMLTLHIVSAIKYFNKWGWLFDKKRSHYNSLLIDRLRQR